MKKRLIVRLFNCLMLSAAAAVCGCQTEKKADDGVTRVLMIGNSFSICCMSHLPAVAADCGVPLDLCSLYIGGCSLERHWSNVQSNAAEVAFKPYLMTRSTLGKCTQGRINVCDALKLEAWDVVTVQQASHESWKPESYRPYGDRLVARIRELAPQAKIVVQETWSYTPWDGRLKTWGIDQNEMYVKLHKAYGDFAESHGLDVIPFGTAVQEWRRRLPVRYTEKSFGGDVVGGGGQDERDHFKRNAAGNWEPNGDVFHLGRNGEYFQALVWASALFDADLAKLTYKPAFVSDSEAKLMREIAGDVTTER